MTAITNYPPPVISELFELLYGRLPTDTEVSNLLRFGVGASEDRRQIVRRIIASTDRQNLATPYAVRFGQTDLLLANCEGFQLFFDEADVAVGRTIGAGNDYERHVLEFLKRHLRLGMTALDLGANIGYFTLHASRLVGDAGHVYACEPNSENCRLILLSLRQNDIRNVELFPVAVGAEMGAIPFTVAMGSNGIFSHDLSDPLMDPNCVIVPVFPLDRLFDKIDFIKADIEGAEGLAIQGARNLVQTCRPIIVSEFCPAMLEVTSKTSPGDFLKTFTALDYQIEILSREQPLSPPQVVADADEFLASYTNPHHIADLGLIPREKISA